MKQLNVQLYPLTRQALEHIVKRRKARGLRATNTSVVEELVFQEAKKENFNLDKK